MYSVMIREWLDNLLQSEQKLVIGDTVFETDDATLAQTVADAIKLWTDENVSPSDPVTVEVTVVMNEMPPMEDIDDERF